MVINVAQAWAICFPAEEGGIKWNNNEVGKWESGGQQVNMNYKMKTSFKIVSNKLTI